MFSEGLSPAAVKRVLRAVTGGPHKELVRQAAVKFRVNSSVFQEHDERYDYLLQRLESIDGELRTLRKVAEDMSAVVARLRMALLPEGLMEGNRCV